MNRVFEEINRISEMIGEDILLKEIRGVRWFILSLVILLVYAFIAKMYQDRSELRARIELLNGKLLVRKRRWFDFSRRYETLKKQGVIDRYPKMAEPTYYLLTKALCAVIGTLGGLVFNTYAGIVGGILGWFFLGFYWSRRDARENDEMVSDVLTLGNVLATQLRGGVYAGDAISECIPLVRSKRLSKALTEFKKHMVLNDMPIKEAIRDLDEKFNNVMISSLCMTITQAEESGKIQGILSDLSKQIQDLEEIAQEKKKAQLERWLTYAMLILFTDIIGYVFLVFLQTIFSFM